GSSRWTAGKRRSGSVRWDRGARGASGSGAATSRWNCIRRWKRASRHRGASMGQKVNPIGLRLGITRSAESRWFADRKQFSEFLHEDIKLRDQIKRKYFHAGISKVEVERAGNRCKITISTARPGIIIGAKGSEIDSLRQALEKTTGRTV